jgi:cyclic beta-1,2-glucan synthetase
MRASLREALELSGWDGAWYRRGYFDDGTPFGSALSEECRIDSIAQSWSVLSGAADPSRAAEAMAQVDAQLIRRQRGHCPPVRSAFRPHPTRSGLRERLPAGPARERRPIHARGRVVGPRLRTKLAGAKAAELFSLLNPINHTSTRTDVRRYRVEPYVVAADVYSVAPHSGRGGWTWYTGSAGWMYRAGVEGILGFHKTGTTLTLDPCIPP